MAATLTGAIGYESLQVTILPGKRNAKEALITVRLETQTIGGWQNLAADWPARF